MQYRTLIISFLLFSSYSIAYATPPAPVPQTGQTLCYNQTGEVIACDGTGQDADIKHGVVWPTPRFVDNGDDSVSDRLTGLMWTKNANAPGPATCNPAKNKTWQEAIDYVECLNANSHLEHNDWRLPNVRELYGLIDIAQSGPALPSINPFTSVQKSNYWSSSSLSFSNFMAFSVSMKTGEIATAAKDGANGLGYAWPVRSWRVSTSPSPIPRTGQISSYATRDDGALQTGGIWPNPRFTNNSNGTATDNLTGLTWLLNPYCKDQLGGINKSTVVLTWGDALIWTNNLSSGACGLSDESDAGDWHLPNRNELLSLIDYGSSFPALPPGHPFSSNSSNSNYWTSSSVSYDGSYAWNTNGIASTFTKKNIHFYEQNHVWPVRSGKNWTFNTLKIYTYTTDLGSVLVNNASATQEIKIRNKGATDLKITTISMTGANGEEFSAALGGRSTCSSLTPTLPPNSYCTIVVAFNPTSSGPKSANLTVVSESVTGNVPLTANGYTTITGVVTDYATDSPLSGAVATLSNGQSTVTFANGFFDFGPVPAGTYSVTVTKKDYQAFTLDNLVVTSTASFIADLWLSPTGFLNLPTQKPTSASPDIVYSYRMRTTGGTYPYTYSIAWGSLPPGLALEPSTGIISGTPAVGSDGDYILAIGVNDSTLPYAAYAETQITINVASPLSLTTSATLAKGMVNSAYSNSIIATGGKTPYTFSLTAGSLPPGLSLSSAGVVSGTPTTAGTYTFTITTTDNATRNTSRVFTLVVLPQLLITTTRLNDSFTNTAYSQTFAGTGGEGAYSWAITSGSLPPGINLNQSTGEISGTPAAPSSQSVTVTVTDAGSRTASKALAINVIDTLAITSTSLADAHVGVPYSQSVAKTGGIAPYTFSYSGVLPVGLTLNTSTGIISGTPTTSGLTNFGITMTDGTFPTPQSANKTLNIRTVIDIPLIVQVTGTGSGTVTSTPSQVNCSTSSCTYPVGTGHTIQLLAVPAVSSIFNGWSGDCTGTGDCSILMSSAKTVNASFTIKTYTVNLSLIGGGTVSSEPVGITCNGSSCSGTFNYGTVLKLIPHPNTGNALAGWGGACTGLGYCNVTLTGNADITAAFSSGSTLSVTVTGEGSGTITSNPVGIVCMSGICSNSFPIGENVTLLNTSSLGSLFSGWSGACQGSGDCTISMDSYKEVTASFTSPLPAKIEQTYYQSLQTAYDNAPPSGATIMLKEGNQSGSFIANANKTVFISGGYSPAYNSSGSDSILQGRISLRQGKTVFRKLHVR